MKILMLSWEYPPCLTGGLGRHVSELAPALAEQGAEVHVVTPCPVKLEVEELTMANLVVHRVDSSTVKSELDIYEQAKEVNALLVQTVTTLWIVEGGFDLIHVHDWQLGFAALELKARYGCPIVTTVHATESGRWRDNLVNPLSLAIDQIERSVMSEVQSLIACSRYMVNRLVNHFQMPAEKLTMIPNGILVDNSFRYDPSVMAEYKRKLVGDDGPLIFSVGRLVYEKGQHVLIGAMPKILAEYPTAKLLLAGKGPRREELETIVDHLDISDSVQFLGFVSDQERNRIFSIADCAVYCSLYEPFGIVALEAMAHNCPVVVSNLDGLAEVVEHEKTGVLVYPDNSDSTAWGIKHLLTHPNLAHEYVTNARQVVAEKYHWGRIAADTLEVYQRTIAQRSVLSW